MAHKILTAWIDVERDGERNDVYIEAEVEYSSTSYGEDADGGRGSEIDVIDNIEILAAQYDSGDDVELTDAEKERAIEAIADKFIN